MYLFLLSLCTSRLSPRGFSDVRYPNIQPLTCGAEPTYQRIRTSENTCWPISPPPPGAMGSPLKVVLLFASAQPSAAGCGCHTQHRDPVMASILAGSPLPAPSPFPLHQQLDPLSVIPLLVRFYGPVALAGPLPLHRPPNPLFGPIVCDLLG
jgi:hypothetical protein